MSKKYKRYLRSVVFGNVRERPGWDTPDDTMYSDAERAAAALLMLNHNNYNDIQNTPIKYFRTEDIFLVLHTNVILI